MRLISPRENKMPKVRPALQGFTKHMKKINRLFTLSFVVFFNFTSFLCNLCCKKSPIVSKLSGNSQLVNFLMNFLREGIIGNVEIIVHLQAKPEGRGIAEVGT